MFKMDKKSRNLELENWLIETTGEEMMTNHLGPNWNRFNDEFGFYPNMSMTIADLVWQHQQAKVEELEGKLKQAYEDVDTFAEAHEYECGFKAQLAKDKAELQKRVDKAIQVINEYYESDGMSGLYFSDLKEILEGEQALKGDS